MQLEKWVSSKCSKLGFYKKKSAFPKKDLEKFKIAKIGKYVVECDWNSKISQSAQKLGFFKN